ncbi:MAG: PEP-utilizing enzyme [Leadbetterella sp.]|nr:PEP-utilizing enzyme [Leadbetterella sp.]
MKNDKSDYSFFWSGFQFHQTLQNQIISYSKYREKVLWNKVDKAFAISRNNNIAYYYSKEDLEKEVEKGKKFLDEKFREDYFRRVDMVCKNYEEYYLNLKKVKLNELSNDDLYKLAEKAVDFWSITIGFFKATQAEGMQHLVEYLKKKVKNDVSELIVPIELDEVNKELIDWQEIVNKSFSKKRLKNHLESYPWLVFFHSTKEEAQDTINERYREDILRKDQRDILKEKMELAIKQKNILEKKPEIKKIVSDLHRFALVRMKMKSLWAGSDYNCMSLFEEISKRTGEKIDDLEKIYLLEDIYNVLVKGVKISEEEKANRISGFAVLWKDTKVVYRSGDEAEVLAEKELKDLYKKSKIKEFDGVIANAGRVIGIARILLSGDITNIRRLRKEFKKGEILVTQMTQPNVMDIAGRAGALITNEGGMLSHAAIVSRELKIPCIVGTHYATDLIEDGDIVEVDADKGIVRILDK